MKKYACPCGYVYDPVVGDPDNGIAPGTAWEDVPADWVCPVCGLGKDAFTEEQLIKGAVFTASFLKKQHNRKEMFR